MEDAKIQDLANLNQEAQAIWNENADFWDERMGEGNQSQRLVTGPALERLLDLHPGEWVLEIACGNGVFTRRMDSRNRLAAFFTLPTKKHLPGRARARRQVHSPQFLDYGSRVRRSHCADLPTAAINEQNTDRRTN